MIDVQVKITGRGAKQEGLTNFSFNTSKELEEWVVSNHVTVAREILKDFQARGEFPKQEFLTITDGVVDNPDLNVKPFGKIEYATKLENITDAVRDAFRLVVERSPLKTGYYQINNVLFYNGKLVAKGLFQVNAWLAKDRDYKNTDRFRIVNLSPYARKLERLGYRRGTSGQDVGQIKRVSRKGLTRSGRKTLLPNGAYMLAHRVAKSRYPQLKNNIRFSFIPIDPNVARQALAVGRDTTGYKFAKNGRPYLYPSISISIRPESFTFNSGFTEQASKL